MYGIAKPIENTKIMEEILLLIKKLKKNEWLWVLVLLFEQK